jgi:hypothetical protein
MLWCSLIASSNATFGSLVAQRIALADFATVHAACMKMTGGLPLSN